MAEHAAVALHDLDDGVPEQAPLPLVQTCVWVEAAVPQAVGQDEGYDHAPDGVGVALLQLFVPGSQIGVLPEHTVTVTDCGSDVTVPIVVRQSG